MTAQRHVFTTPGMTRAKALLRDATLWAEDTALEKAEVERATRELEEAADKARQAILAGDPVKIIERACICFAGIEASIDPDTGDVLIIRDGAACWLDDTQLVSFVYGGFATVPVP